MAKKKPKKLLKRTLNSTLYCYVEPDNAKHAKTEGKRVWGSFSAYVNVLIANDRGVVAKLGAWRGATEEKRTRKKKSRGKAAGTRAKAKRARSRKPVTKRNTGARRAKRARAKRSRVRGKR